jgi:single-strand DNA-binding protein
MNKIIVSGRLTKDIEVKEVKDTVVGNGTIAVDRPYNEETDFFVFSVWGKAAENAAKFTKKGSRVILSGSINIDQAGDKYYTKIKVDSIEFLDRPSDQEPKAKMNKPTKSFKFEDEEGDDLPF